MIRAALLVALAACSSVEPSDALALAEPDARPGALGLIVVDGQSNAVGGARTADLPPELAVYAAPYPAVLRAYQMNCPKEGVAGACSLVQGWAPLAPRAGTTGDLFGVELGLGRELDALGRDVAILTTATNGSGLNKEWEPEASPGTWQWQYMTSAIDARLAELPTGSYVAGLVVVGAEADAHTQSLARMVDDELAWMTLAFRARYGDVPVVVTELSAPGLEYTADISERQWRLVGRVPRLAVIETGDLVYRDGIQHYDAASFITLGVRIADAFGGGL